jgi:hypothetical protein
VNSLGSRTVRVRGEFFRVRPEKVAMATTTSAMCAKKIKIVLDHGSKRLSKTFIALQAGHLSRRIEPLQLENEAKGSIRMARCAPFGKQSEAHMLWHSRTLHRLKQPINEMSVGRSHCQGWRMERPIDLPKSSNHMGVAAIQARSTVRFMPCWKRATEPLRVRCWMFAIAQKHVVLP